MCFLQNQLWHYDWQKQHCKPATVLKNYDLTIGNRPTQDDRMTRLCQSKCLLGTPGS